MRLGDDHGGVTAELALTLPAVVAVLALCLGGVQLGATRLRAEDAAIDAARLLGRGESSGAAAARVAEGLAGATLVRRDRGDLVCVAVSAPGAARGPLAAIRVGGEGCALGGGR